MNEKNSYILWIIVGVLVIWIVGTNLGLFSAASSSVTRSVPSSAIVSSAFDINYTVSSPDAKWGVSLTSTLSGSCKFEDGTNQIKFVMLSTTGSSKTYKAVGNSVGSCIITGDYQFGNSSLVYQATSVVNIVASQNSTICNAGQTKCEGLTSFNCSNNAWVSNGLVNGRCGYTPVNNTNQTNQTAQTYYRLSNNTCSEITIYPAQKTSNDYLTLAQCQAKITTQESFWSKEIFKIGEFSVTGLILVASLGLLLLFILIKK